MESGIWTGALEVSEAAVAASAVAASAVDRVEAVEPQAVGRRLMMNAKYISKPFICFAWLLLFNPNVNAELRIPEAPAQNGHGDFTQDYAGVIDMERDINHIGFAQKLAFEEHDTPIIVIVITRMASYGYYDANIQPFAKQWFNKWEIGTEQIDNKNQGILLLISVGDRTGRIELGEDWGRRFDNHCQTIMDKVMIPHFKNGNYSLGITKGVESLLELAKTGVKGNIQSIPTPKSSNSVITNVYRAVKNNDLVSWPIRIIAILLGITGIVMGCKLESGFFKKITIICSSLLIILGIFPPLFLFVIIVLPIFCGGGGSYSGGSFSGGGYSGGSSGGGGASGSW